MARLLPGVEDAVAAMALIAASRVMNDKLKKFLM